MLHGQAIKCDQLYNIAWRESKYTLIHLKQSRRVRISAMNKAMTQLQEQYKIQGSCIVGYETLACNEQGESSVTEHPAFKRMVHLLNSNGDITIWMEEGDVRSNKKGLLWKEIDNVDLKLKTHAQLIQQIKKWEPIVKESNNIKTENELLKSTLLMREKELITAQRTIRSQDEKNEKMFQEVMLKIQECTALKRRLIQHHIVHTWVAETPN